VPPAATFISFGVLKGAVSGERVHSLPQKTFEFFFLEIAYCGAFILMLIAYNSRMLSPQTGKICLIF